MTKHIHFYRNVLSKMLKSRRPKVAAMLKALHAMESREASKAKALEVTSELEKSKLGEAAKGSGTATPRPWPTRASRASTGGGSGPATPSNA